MREGSKTEVLIYQQNMIYNIVITLWCLIIPNIGNINQVQISYFIYYFVVAYKITKQIVH